MAVLIVLAEDPSPTKDSAEHPERWQVNHTLGIKPDGWVPGAGEKDNPLYEFIQVEGEPEAWAYLLEEPARDAEGKRPARRVRSLDVAAIRAGGKGVTKVDAKLGAVIEISKAELDKAVSVDAAVVAEAVDGN